jgi:predicted RNA-binding protein with PIN domain
MRRPFRGSELEFESESSPDTDPDLDPDADPNPRPDADPEPDHDHDPNPEPERGGAAPGSAAEKTRPVWLIDGYNVLHAGVLRGRDRQGWWKAETQERLVALAESFDDPSAELWVVFDASEKRSQRCAEPRSARVHVVFTASADDWLVKRVRSDPAPERLVVVTADRQVAGRARHRGASVVSPLAFLARCGGRSRCQPAPADAPEDAPEDGPA